MGVCAWQFTVYSLIRCVLGGKGTAGWRTEVLLELGGYNMLYFMYLRTYAYCPYGLVTYIHILATTYLVVIRRLGDP